MTRPLFVHQMHRTTGLVFQTEQAREVAHALLGQMAGMHAFMVAPPELLNEAWVKQATQACRSKSGRYVRDKQFDEPLSVLAEVDSLYVIADGPRPQHSNDLQLSPPIEDLLWLAINLGLKSKYYQIDHSTLSNPEEILKKSGAPERVAAHKAERAAFTQQLPELRIDSDYGSSGLWNMKGQNLHYDLLDLPFELLRRIAAWQRDYDFTATPPGHGDDDAWWERHEQETVHLAVALQAALGPRTVVKLYRPQGWVSIQEVIDAMERDA